LTAASRRASRGLYGIQGLAGGFVERIEGSYSGVMGLPLLETAARKRQNPSPLGRGVLRIRA